MLDDLLKTEGRDGLDEQSLSEQNDITHILCHLMLHKPKMVFIQHDPMNYISKFRTMAMEN